MVPLQLALKGMADETLIGFLHVCMDNLQVLDQDAFSVYLCYLNTYV